MKSPQTVIKKPLLLKALLIMKLTILFTFFFATQVVAKGFGQDGINLKLKKVEIADVLSSIEKQTNYRFLYNNDLSDIRDKVSISVTNAGITEVLNILLGRTKLLYQRMDNNLIVIKEKMEVPDVIIKGKVTAPDGTPVAGASVQVKGTTRGTTTNNDGNFTLSVPDGNVTLVVSYVGYDTQEITVGGRTDISISLVLATRSLEQVVVIGYGTSRKRDVTGSVVSVKGGELAKQPVQTATQALQGKVAGVQIIGSGEPNTLPTVRVRGVGSQLAALTPLYVVDGVLTDDIRNINTADILTMDVLKDASATAIYGVRGANGVLIITTKKGRAGKMQFAYDANIGVREATNLVNMAGENQYAGYLNEANIYYGSGDSLVLASNRIGANTDWYDVILRDALQQNHNLSLSGGSDKFTYFLSTGFLKEDGIQVGNKYNRFTVRSNNEYRISSKVKLNALLSYTRGDADGANFGAFENAFRAAPIILSKVGDRYGNTSAWGNVANPLLSIEKTDNEVLVNRIQGAFAVDYKIIPVLTFRSSMGIDMNWLKTTNYDYKFLSDANTFITPGGNQQRARSQLTLEKNDVSRWVWDNTLTFAKTFGNHNLTAMVGMTAEEYRANNVSSTALDVPEIKSKWYINAGVEQTISNTGDKSTRNSYIGRLTYGFKNRYFFTGTMRADGTSRFNIDNRWGYFPSVGTAWTISEESFMDNQKVFDNLKLRAGWGRVGNDNVPSSSFLSLANVTRPYYFDGTLYRAITFDNIIDQNLHWETIEEFNIGLDFSTLGKRLSGEIDLYDRKTTNALTIINIPLILGDDQYYTNAATISNKGVELGLNWNDKIGNNWTYSVGGNISFNKNRTVKLNGGQALFDGSVNNGLVTKSDNGVPIGSFFLLQMDGIFQSEAEIAGSAQPNAIPGDIRYRDISGPAGKPDGVINDFDRAYSGSYIPKMTYGVNASVGYKNIDLSIGGYGTSGSKVYNARKALRGTGGLDNVETAVAKGRWTPNNPSNSIPRATTSRELNSTYFLENGNFFRLNNLTVGYTLPKKVLDAVKISSFRVYATVQNLFTLTHYSGFTPEVTSTGPLNSGIDLNAYPSTRTFALGINLGF